MTMMTVVAALAVNPAVALAIMACAALAADEPGPASQPANGVLRVCADPNNMPFSSVREDGFENRLARLAAAALGMQVEYTWWAQHRGFVRKTLKAGDCDVLMGVPVGLAAVETTRPYYGSTYVFVSRADRRLDVASIRDARLRSLKIGVQLVGDNGFNTPPAHAIAAQGITGNVTGYSLYGDYDAPNPPARIIDAVENGDVDIAAVWGPLAGWFARRSGAGLTVTPIEDTAAFAGLTFRFNIAMGVRKGDDALRDRLDAVIAREQPAITELLRSYGVPLVEAGNAPAAPAAPAQPAQ
jgi:quinoprotein dehydrogenase-associated probable ABC transporter substrate-binding protein